MWCDDCWIWEKRGKSREIIIVAIKFKIPKELDVNLFSKLFSQARKSEAVKGVCPNLDDGSGSPLFEI